MRVQKNLNIEKIIFKVVQIKFLAMHINNKKINVDVFSVVNLLNIFMEHDLNCQESRPGVLSLSTRGRHLPSSWTQLSSLHTPVHPLIRFPAGPHHLWTI